MQMEQIENRQTVINFRHLNLKGILFEDILMPILRLAKTIMQ